jgi:DTW domain-containing protein YfiP
MRQKLDQKLRCPVCRMHMELCVCHLSPCLDIKTRVEVIIHYADIRKMSNSGRLATLALKNSAVHVRGIKEKPVESLTGDHYTDLVLFPGQGSVELADDMLQKIKKPIRLIIPDGNWNQASSMVKREPLMKDVIKVHLPAGILAKYRIRSQEDPFRLNTFEAIIRALGVIEGSEVEKALDAFFRVWVYRSLYIKGRIAKVNMPKGMLTV